MTESSPTEEADVLLDAGAAGVVPRGGRHSSREVALQVLYAIDLAAVSEARARKSAEEQALASALSASEEDAGRDRPGDGAARPSERARDVAFDRVMEHFSVPRSAVEFARELVDGVLANGEELDVLLAQHARNWRISRMAAVDRNILRLAIYELRDTTTPVAVVIDEAIDLARRFGSDSSPSFVNGVLDGVAREVRAA